MQYTLLYTQEPEWGFTVEVVELPGCVTYGETLTEAEEMIQDAISAYKASQKKHQEISPLKRTFISSMFVHETV